MDSRKTVSLVAITSNQCRIFLPHDLRASISTYLALRHLPFLPYAEKVLDPPDPFKHDAAAAGVFTVIWRLRIQAAFDSAKMVVENWISDSQLPIEFHTGLDGKSWDWVLTFDRQPAFEIS